MRTGSVADEHRSGRPPTSQERVKTICEAIERTPRASTRRLSRELGILHATVWKVLHFTLKKKAYRIQMLHKLETEDYAARCAMCYDLCEAAEREHLMDNILFSDEATFHICGMVNRHNCRICGNERPDDTSEWQRHTPKVNVWVGINKQTMYGPFIFVENTVTGGMYLDMLEEFLEPQLQQDGILGTLVYQQDGAPPHFALPV